MMMIAQNTHPTPVNFQTKREEQMTFTVGKQSILRLLPCHGGTARLPRGAYETGNQRLPGPADNHWAGPRSHQALVDNFWLPSRNY